METVTISPRRTPSRAHAVVAPVLVYGTLRKGQPNAGLLAGRATYGATIRIEGFALIDAGWFPYAVPAEGESITVEVVSLHPNRAGETLRDLDRLEGFIEGNPASLYTRELVSWRDGHGVLRQGWLYVPSAATQARITRSGDTTIPSGDWNDR